MIIYNITCKVDRSVHSEWLVWIKKEYIPDILSAAFFYHGQLVKLLYVDETDGPTYALQLYAQTIENYQQFISGSGATLLRRQQERWGEAVVTFGTVMQRIE